MGLNVAGLMNVQLAVDNNLCREVNPRASRTVPFVSKCGVSLKICCCMAVKLLEQIFESYSKLGKKCRYIRPNESTGEVMALVTLVKLCKITWCW